MLRCLGFVAGSPSRSPIAINPLATIRQCQVRLGCLRGLVVALASSILLLSNPGDAQAYCQSTTCSDLNTCTGNAETLQNCPIKRWNRMPIPVRFFHKLSTRLILAETKRAIRSAMNRWSDVICANGERTSLRFQELSDTLIDKPRIEPNVPLTPGKGTEPFGIYFREQGWDVQERNDTIAATYLYTGKTDPVVTNAQILINNSDFTFALDEEVSETEKYAPLGDKRVDLEAVMTHEFGHYIGLAHNRSEVVSIMSEGQCSLKERCDIRQAVVARRLRPDDELAVCTLYPPGRVLTEPESASSGCQLTTGTVPYAPAGTLAASATIAALVVGARSWRRRQSKRTLA
jgi:hypothetical protein